MPDQPQTPAAIIEALRRDLSSVLERMPADADSALHYEPLPGEDA
jgi:hypothetical protein